MPEEYERIVEFSYSPKHERFVFRFLDGSSYSLDIINLPKKLQTRKPEWEEAYLSGDKSVLFVHVKKEVREIPAFLIHSKGKPL